jgi:hypothetical protein
MYVKWGEKGCTTYSECWYGVRNHNSQPLNYEVVRAYRIEQEKDWLVAEKQLSRNYQSVWNSQKMFPHVADKFHCFKHL